MGRVYIWLDKGLVHPTGPILETHIDADFEAMGRRELCRHIEKKFGWKEDSFWSLESTQKIRLCCQQARNMFAMADMNTSGFGDMTLPICGCYDEFCTICYGGDEE